MIDFKPSRILVKVPRTLDHNAFEISTTEFFHSLANLLWYCLDIFDIVLCVPDFILDHVFLTPFHKDFAKSVTLFLIERHVLTSQFFNLLKIFLVLDHKLLNVFLTLEYKDLASFTTLFFNERHVLIAQFFNFIKNISIKTWNTIKNGVLGAVRLLNTGVRKIFGTLRSWIISTWTSIKNKVVALAKLLYVGAKAAFNSLWNATKKIFTTLKNWALNNWRTLKTVL